MNNKLFSFAVAAATVLAFASCNKNDDLKSDIISPGATSAYAKVSITMPKGTQTRAGETFDAGTKEEATVSSIFLAFYDDNGLFVGSGSLVVGEPTGSRPGTESISDTYKEQLCKVELLGEGTPTQVVAFINAGKVTANLTDLLRNGNEKGVINAEKLHADETNFVMTNAGYYDGDTYKMAVELKSGALFEAANDEEAAQKLTDPQTPTTEIYVERLAAKITVDKSDQYEENLNYTIKDVSGETIDLNFEPTKWGVTGVADKVNYLKFLSKDNVAATGKFDWNDKNNFRSYWAEGVYYDSPFDTYYDEEEKATTNNSPLTYITYGDAANDEAEGLNELEATVYVPEHTTNLQIAAASKNLIANTYVLVIGNYSVNCKTETSHNDWFTSGEDTDFYLLLNAVTFEGDDATETKKAYTIYNKSQLIGYLLDFNEIKMVGTSNDEINQKTLLDNDSFNFAEYLDLEADPTTGKYKLTVKTETGDKKLYYKPSAEGDAKEIDADVLENCTKQTNSRHFHYDKGHTFFNVPIWNFGIETNGSDAIYGVVRNHSYQLHITEVVNLGAPIDPDMHENENDPIIPDPDDLIDHWIKAKINVLSWNVKEHNVTL